MDNFYIKGGHKVTGSLDVATSKNAVLPIIAASVMCDGVVTITHCPDLLDVGYMIKILESLGSNIYKQNDALIIDPTSIDNYYINEEYTKKVRSSIFMLGPLLSKFKHAKVAYPGGCNIGSRPIDLHLKGLKSLNVKISERHGYIFCDGTNMLSGEIHLDFPSVGATENLVMASVLLNGKTTIYNCAREPEIDDLVLFLNDMGAKIYGMGTSTLVIDGVKKLNSVEYTPIKDRIICGTYLIGCACTGGMIELIGSPRIHNLALISKLSTAGCKFRYTKSSIIMECNTRPKSIQSIETQPFPGFPTDLQNQILALQTISKGTSVITENLFETRYKVVTELNKMGANITIKDRIALVNGINKLYGATVVASDLRGGASLILAGMCADGYTTIEDIYHIDRGYEKIEEDLKKLNVEITRRN